MALPTSEITAAKYPTATTPAPQTREPLPAAAEPGRSVAEGHELIDADPLTVRLRDPIEKTHPIRLNDKADRSNGLTTMRPRHRIPARSEHAPAAKPGEIDAVRCLRTSVPMSNAWSLNITETS
jgi:hypothetical protein